MFDFSPSDDIPSASSIDRLRKVLLAKLPLRYVDPHEWNVRRTMKRPDPEVADEPQRALRRTDITASVRGKLHFNS
jgi:hypothetical protein